MGVQNVQRGDSETSTENSTSQFSESVTSTTDGMEIRHHQNFQNARGDIASHQLDEPYNASATNRCVNKALTCQRLIEIGGKETRKKIFSAQQLPAPFSLYPDDVCIPLLKVLIRTCLLCQASIWWSEIPRQRGIVQAGICIAWSVEVEHAPLGIVVVHHSRSHQLPSAGGKAPVRWSPSPGMYWRLIEVQVVLCKHSNLLSDLK